MKRVELYARVRHAVMIEGLSQREAARRFGIDPRTVGKMLRYSVPPGYVRTRPPVRPKLGPFIGVIDRILDEDKERPKKQRHTSKRIAAPTCAASPQCSRSSRRSRQSPTIAKRIRPDAPAPSVRHARALQVNIFANVFFVIAPSSQELEPPANPGRFTSVSCTSCVPTGLETAERRCDSL